MVILRNRLMPYRIAPQPSPAGAMLVYPVKSREHLFYRIVCDVCGQGRTIVNEWAGGDRVDVYRRLLLAFFDSGYASAGIEVNGELHFFHYCPDCVKRNAEGSFFIGEE